jgi:large subunit ribosomal protein L5
MHRIGEHAPCAKQCFASRSDERMRSKKQSGGFFAMQQRLKDIYENTIVPSLMEQFNYTHRLQVPRLTKIVINRGLGDASQNTNIVELGLQELSLISGQKGVITRSKRAIAGFKLREKTPVGVSVTLRGERMYSFLDRLINLALPRIKDFQGISPQSFDGRGNYTFGLNEQLMFPEIEFDRIQQIRGMDISIVTTSSTDVEGRALLQKFGMPFKA